MRYRISFKIKRMRYRRHFFYKNEINREKNDIL
jgi:hypothetical protein